MLLLHFQFFNSTSTMNCVCFGMKLHQKRFSPGSSKVVHSNFMLIEINKYTGCFSKIVREKRTQNIWMHNYKYASLEHVIGPSKIEKWMLPILIVVLFSVLFCLFKFSFSANSNRFSFTTIIFTLRFVNASINETIVKQLAITEWFNDLFV